MNPDLHFQGTVKLEKQQKLQFFFGRAKIGNKCISFWVLIHLPQLL